MSEYTFAETVAPEGAPLCLTFHGTGADETQFHGYAASTLPGTAVISPRGDVSEFGALRYFRRTGEGVYDMEDLAARTQAMAGFIAAQIERLKPAHVMAFGYSNGANILASVMMARPGLIGRAALLHPLIPWQPDPQPGLAGVPVLITAGERDPICPAPLTQQFESYLTAQGALVETLWHPGGHEIAASEAEALGRFLTAK